MLKLGRFGAFIIPTLEDDVNVSVEITQHAYPIISNFLTFFCLLKITIVYEKQNSIPKTHKKNTESSSIV